MFKQLLEIWRESQDPLREMVADFELMLDKGQLMFRAVTDALFLGGDFTKLKEETYETDGQLNELEQKIRRNVVVHLSLGHTSDLTPSLILMSIVKDAERIGDYAKNVFEIGEIIAPLKSGTHLDEIQETRNAIIGYFGEVKKAFVDSDEDLARRLLGEFFTRQKDIDSSVGEILNNQGQENSVAFALLLRFFKRILSHLGNIATSVVMPIDKLDYFDEDNRGKMNDL